MLAPAIGGEPAAARAIGRDAAAAGGIAVASAPTRDGWSLAASVPLALLGVGRRFALDLVVSAVPAEGQGLLKAHLAGESHPHGDSTGYLWVEAVP